jgi:exopolyphosphatase/pppGpp-phosphohydrolase
MNEPTPAHSSAAPAALAEAAQADMRARFRHLRARAGLDGAVMVLHIGAEYTAIATGQGDEATAALVLDIGAQKTARQFFKRSPPTPLEMENAIATVEDEVIRAVPMLAPGTALLCADAVVREIALLAGVAPGESMAMSLDAMERVFERLAAVAEGRPVVREGLPQGADFAAALLILREFMHHLRFAVVTMVS